MCVGWIQWTIAEFCAHSKNERSSERNQVKESNDIIEASKVFAMHILKQNVEQKLFSLFLSSLCPCPSEKLVEKGVIDKKKTAAKVKEKFFFSIPFPPIFNVMHFSTHIRSQSVQYKLYTEWGELFIYQIGVQHLDTSAKQWETRQKSDWKKMSNSMSSSVEKVKFQI